MAIRYSSPIVSDNLISLIDFSNIKSVKFSDDFTFVDIINKENVISSCGNTTLGKKSLYFSGSTGSQLDLQDLITSRIIETNVSFSIWFKLSNLSSDHFLIKTGDEDSDPPINIFFDTSATGVENTGGSDIGGGNTNVITCQFSDSTQDYKFTTSNNIINASQWYNLTVSLDFSSNIHHMYLDGSLVAKWNHTIGSNGIKSHNNSFLLGKGLNGNIGKFYAYRKSLNSEEVKQNYDVEVFRDFDQDSLIDRLVLNASPFDSSVPNRSEKISQLSNDAIFTSIGSTDWTVPSGVYEISVVCIGGGGGGSGSVEGNFGAAAGGGGGALRYVNNIDVTPGETLTVIVGAGGGGGNQAAGSNGGTSSLSRTGTILCSAAGGGGGIGNGSNASGGSTGIGTGGNGGNGGRRDVQSNTTWPGAGGGAGGYSGNGGNGGQRTGFNTTDGNGSGGAAAGGSFVNDDDYGAGAGGGVGLYGEGESGLYNYDSTTWEVIPGGASGSSGFPGEESVTDIEEDPYNLSVGTGGLYGGGGGAGSRNSTINGGNGGQGAVRIVWGGCLDGTYYGREFPSSNSNQIYSNSSLPFSSIPVLHLDAGDTNSYSGIGTTWTDLSGNGNDGTLYNQPTYSSSDGGYFEFDGSDEMVNVTNFSITSSYTINMFIKFLDTSTGNKAILDFGSQPDYSFPITDENFSANPLRLYLNGGNVKIQHNSPFNATGVASTIGITTNTWYNLTVTYDGFDAKLYFNSTLNSSGGLPSPTINSQNYNVFGIANKPLGNGSGILPLNCRISRIEIFDRELNQTEITDNFNALKGRYGL